MRFRLALALVVATAACMPNTDALRARGAFDLDCSADKLQIVMLDHGNAMGGDGIYGVAGCGRRATYIYTQTRVWVMDSASTEAGPAASAATSAVSPAQPGAAASPSPAPSGSPQSK